MEGFHTFKPTPVKLVYQYTENFIHCKRLS